MPRPGLTYDEIAAAASELTSQGTKPTIQNVREALGDRGSPVTISKHLKTWKETQKTGLMQAETPSSTPGKLSRRAPSKPLATSPESTIEVSSIEPLTAEQTIPTTTANTPDAASTTDAPDLKQPLSPEASASSNSPKTSTEKTSDKKNKILKKREHHKNSSSHKENNGNKDTVTVQRDSLELTAASLMGLSDDHLKIKILQLETAIVKEQSRREAAEAMARDIKDYAELLKSEIQQRISDMEDSYERTIAELKANAEQLRKNAAEDLKFYRSALEKANVKLGQK